MEAVAAVIVTTNVCPLGVVVVPAVDRNLKADAAPEPHTPVNKAIDVGMMLASSNSSWSKAGGPVHALEAIKGGWELDVEIRSCHNEGFRTLCFKKTFCGVSLTAAQPKDKAEAVSVMCRRQCKRL
jgi:hypothetical protein